MKYKAVGFDYGGVINGQPGSKFTELFCKFVGIDEVAYKKAYFRYNRTFNAGKPITERELWTLVLTDLDKLDKLNGVMKFVSDIRTKQAINTNVLQLVDDLRVKGYKTGLLSNNNIEAAEKMRAIDLDKHFDVFIVSAEVGLMKPDIEIFKLFIEQLKIKVEELIFIDDAQKSLATAKECGFTPILFTSYNHLVKQLSQLGVIEE